MENAYDDMYFVSLLFAYGAELSGRSCDGTKQEFSFADTSLEKVFLLEEGSPVPVIDLSIEETYGYYQKRKLLYPPNFPDGRRRFLELLHAKEF